MPTDDEFIDAPTPEPVLMLPKRRNGRPTLAEAAAYRALEAELERLGIHDRARDKGTSTARAVEWRKRKVGEGWRSKSYLLAPHVLAALKAACQREGVSEADYISRLILAADEVI